VETQLYALKQRVSNLYFGVLLIEAQLAQNQLNAETLQSQLEKAQVALKHGTTLPSNVAELKAELLRLAMQRTEYEATKGMYLKMLSTFIGKNLPEDTALQRPEPRVLSRSNHRPELRGFDLRQTVLDAQERLLTSEYLPKIGLFFQGAYGRPTLNIIKNEFDWYYIAGVRLQWNLSPLYSLSNKKQLLRLQGESLLADRKAFLMSTELDLIQQDTQLSKLQRLMEHLERMIDVEWDTTGATEFHVEIVVEACDRMGLIEEVGGAIRRAGGNILSTMSGIVKGDVARMRYLIAISDASLLDPLLALVSNVPSVFDCRRIMAGEGAKTN